MYVRLNVSSLASNSFMNTKYYAKLNDIDQLMDFIEFNKVYV